MKISNKQEGQTLIETALILFIILLIVLGIAEFSRAWYAKNSIKNAARQGARVAVVTPNAPITLCPNNPMPCDQTRSFTNCPGSDVIINSVCNSAGVSSASTRVSRCFINGPGPLTTLDSGDTVNVCVQTDFATAVPKFPGLGNILPTTLHADASMRYE
jgi:hypothetical protein